jgi:hypothetical protein
MNVDGEATLECRRLRTTAEEAPEDPDLHRLASWALPAAEPRRHHGLDGVSVHMKLSSSLRQSSDRKYTVKAASLSIERPY